MKKLICMVICITIVAGLFNSAALASEEIKVILNGERLSFSVPPIVVDGSTLVPMRAIFEALDANVQWNAGSRTVTATRGNTEISLQIDSAVATVNKTNVVLNVPARVVNGSTLVPLRFVGESLDCDVKWDGTSRQITIDSKQVGGMYDEFPSIPRLENIRPSLQIWFSYQLFSSKDSILLPPADIYHYTYEVGSIAKGDQYLLQYSNYLQSLGWRLLSAKVNTMTGGISPMEYNLVSPDNMYRIEGVTGLPAIGGTVPRYSIGINVISYPQSPIRMYYASHIVPDFGAFFDIPLRTKSDTIWLYDASRVNANTHLAYQMLLMDFGFKRVEGRENTFINSNNITVATGYSELGNFYVGVILGTTFAPSQTPTPTPTPSPTAPGTVTLTADNIWNYLRLEVSVENWNVTQSGSGIFTDYHYTFNMRMRFSKIIENVTFENARVTIRWIQSSGLRFDSVQREFILDYNGNADITQIVSGTFSIPNVVVPRVSQNDFDIISISGSAKLK